MMDTNKTPPKSILKKFIDKEKELPRFVETDEGEDTHQLFTTALEYKGVLKHLIMNWKCILIILVPILLAPLLFLKDVDENEKPETKFKCAYVVILMIVSWMLQLLPIAVTSLLPFLLFPIFDILDAEQVAKSYVKDSTVLFVGCLIIALAVEYCNLHRRIAMLVMKSVGCSPRRLTLGTMMTTAFLSMWISNTATAGMAIPIVSATVEEIFPTKPPCSSTNRRKSVFRVVSEPDLEDFERENTTIFYIGAGPDSNESKKRNLKKALFLAVCLAANIGGTGVLTGTTSNLILLEHLKYFNIGQNGKYRDITFSSWMLYNIPPVVVNLVVCWLYLVVHYNGVPEWLCFWKKPIPEEILKRKQENQRHKQINEHLAEKYNDLGPISFHESAVLVLFVSTVFLWFFRDPGFVVGWGPYLPAVDESIVAIFTIFLFFIIPRVKERNPVTYAALLEWKFVQDSVPWGLVILLGGGHAMSEGVVESGLSQWLGAKLLYMNRLPGWLLLFILMFFTVVCTTFASNSATASTLLPLLTPLSRSLNLHPLYLTLPSTVACSYSFLLPISTPPNALVYQAAGEDLSIGEMAKVMTLPNIVCVVILFLFHISYGNRIFHFNNYIYSDIHFTNHNITDIPPAH